MKTFSLLLSICVPGFLGSSLHAAVRSSTTHTVLAEAPDAGGGSSTSAAFANVASIGLIAGVQSSATYSVQAGYVPQTGSPGVGPAGGAMTLSPASPVDPGTALTVTFSGWSDDDLPLSYTVLIDNVVVSPAGNSTLRNLTAPTTPGTYTLKGQVRDALNHVTEVSQTFTVNSAQESWRLQYFGTTANSGNAADSENPDGDGLDNFGEFAFGLNPTVNETAALVVSGGAIVQRGTPTVRVENIPNGVDFRAVFGRRKDYLAAGLVYAVQFSADLATWQTSTATPAVIADDGDIEAVTVPYPFFINGRKARFFRVSVSVSAP